MLGENKKIKQSKPYDKKHMKGLNYNVHNLILWEEIQ